MTMASVDARSPRRISLIDINLTSAEQLAIIPKIDNELAKTIINPREEKGYFENINGLLNVPGISGKLFK